MCTLNRRLRQADWDTILGYTHRVRKLTFPSHSCDLSADSFEELSKPPSSTVSVFPKLRCLKLPCPTKALACFVRQYTSPGLTQLYLRNAERLDSSTDDFGVDCPNAKFFSIGMSMSAQSDMMSGFICHWPNLQNVDCFEVGLDVAAFAHLSCLDNLCYLRFKLDDEVIDWVQSCQSSPSVLTFARLRNLLIDSRSLVSAWRFLHHLRLPVIKQLAVEPYNKPASPDLMSFLAELQSTCAHDTLCNLSVYLHNPLWTPDSLYFDVDQDPPRYHITSDHLHPLTVFTNIQSMEIHLSCGVDLNEHDLLCLAASWPHLEYLSVNETPHQTRSNGITPGGFVQLLEICRSLRELDFKFDARGYTEPPQGHPWRGLRMQNGGLHPWNSPIEEESVYPLGIFFHVAPYPHFGLSAFWSDSYFQDLETEIPKELCDVYRDRWKRVDTLARKLWEEREALKRSLLARFSDKDVL